MELDLHLAQKRSCVGRWSWAAKVGLSHQVVTQQQCNGHCPCESAQARQMKQQLRSALVAGQWRGDTALTFPLFWRRSTVSPVFLGAISAVEPLLFRRPPPPPFLSLISHLASVDIKQNVLNQQKQTCVLTHRSYVDQRDSHTSLQTTIS